jgi:uncharacterized protein with PIN domain
MRAYFRFYGELNDFLPEERRQVTFAYEFIGHETVKHLLESFGVPHTEVDLILVMGESVDFDRQLQGGELVSVYPVFESIDISSLARVRPEPLREPKFVLDNHLGKLTNYMRMLGLDALYRNDFDDDELAQISENHNRILLTRDRGLLKRNQVTHGYLIRDKDPREQLVEVLRRFDLFSVVDPFRRCIRCNGILEPVSKEQVIDQLEPKTKLYFEDFRICQECGQVYWRGSHFERMETFIDEIMSESGWNQEE